MSLKDSVEQIVVSQKAGMITAVSTMGTGTGTWILDIIPTLWGGLISVAGFILTCFLIRVHWQNLKNGQAERDNKDIERRKLELEEQVQSVILKQEKLRLKEIKSGG